MKFKEPFLTSGIGKEKIIPMIFCLLMFLSGCFEDADKTTEEKKPSETDNNKSKKEEAMIPKALHDDLMSEQEARCQELNLKIELAYKDLQEVQAEREKLLAHLEKFNELKHALATTQEELKRVMAQSEGYKTSAQAATGANSAANAQAIRQLTASNSQLSQELATSKQRVGPLELSVSRIQNPANMLKIRQLYLEKTYLSK